MGPGQVPGGLSFSEFRGYENWQLVAVAHNGDKLDAVFGNPAMIEAYRSGIPENGKPFPDGAMMAKTHWMAKKLEDQPGGPVVPGTLHDALMAQLDQLGEAKAVAQHAAVLGHDFSLPLLTAVADRDAGGLVGALRRLIAARIVVEHPTGPGMFGFRHALLRDIAYRSLLRRNRRRIHLRAAEALAERQGAGEGATADLIARHYSLGENYADAVRFRLQGANAAIAPNAIK